MEHKMTFFYYELWLKKKKKKEPTVRGEEKKRRTRVWSTVSEGAKQETEFWKRKRSSPEEAI